MAKQYGKNSAVDFAAANLMSFGKSFSRLSGQPLDKSEIWYDNLEALKAYALTDAAYVGQKVVYIDTATSKITHYSIELDGSLKEVGVVPAGDGKTISVTEDGVISILGAGEATAGQQLKIENVGTEDEPVLKAVWFTPNAADASDVVNLGNRLDTAEDDIDAVEDRLDTAEADIDAVEKAIADHKADKANPHGVTKEQVGLGNVTNDAQVKRSEMGVAGGVATLDSDGKVPASQLPSYVDDVVEGYLSEGKFYSDAEHATELTAEDSKIYVDIPTGKTYRWGGTTYVVISETVALGETTGTAYDGAKGKANADAIAKLNGADTETGSVANTVKTAIEGLDVEDTAENYKYVSEVSEADGKISVKRADLDVAAVSGLQAALDLKADDTTVDGIDERLTNAEKTISTLVGGEEGSSLGTLAYKNAVAKTDLDEALKTELEGKLDASEVTGDLLTHKAEEFATAAQGETADKAVQTLTVLGQTLSKTNNTLTADQAKTALGLGTAAYESKETFAEAGHNHDNDYAAKALEQTVTDHKADTTSHITADERTKWNEASTNADTAVQSVATGSENGTIAVDGKNVAVAGLGSAAYTEAGAYATKAQGDLADTAVQNLTVLGQSLSKASPSLTVDQAKTALGLKSAAYEETNAFDAAGTAATAKSEVIGTAADGKSADTVYGAKAFATDAVSALDGQLKAVAKSGKASDVAIDDADGKIDATTVEAALAELATKIATADSEAEVTVEALGADGDYSQRYVVKQNGTQVGATINIPKDMVVESGSVVTLESADEAGHEAGTYLKLVLANATEDEIWIPASSLIEYVTGGTHAEGMITITVDAEHVATAKINDGTVTKAKLDAGVQASLGKADSAVQTVETGTTDGTIKVDDKEVAVAGLKSAAYAETTAFDAAGSAAAALAEAKLADDKTVLYAGELSLRDDTAQPNESGIYAYYIPLYSDDTYEVDRDQPSKVFINGVLYVVTDNYSGTLGLEFEIESSDTIYVEQHVKLKA